MDLVVRSLNASSSDLVIDVTNVFLALALTVLDARWMLDTSPVPIGKCIAFCFRVGEGYLFICLDIGGGVFLGFANFAHTASSLITSWFQTC